MPLSRPPLIFSEALRRGGDSPRHLERGARGSQFVRIRPGAYLPAGEWTALDARSRHLAAMFAVAGTSRRPLLFSDDSAAALHGIPLLGGWTATPHLVGDVGHRRAALVGVTTHRRMLAEHEVVEVDGFAATSPLRTAFDVAAGRGFLAGVVAIDHVIGPSFGIERVAAEQMLEARRGSRGFRRIEQALAVATGLAESPLESLSLGQCHLLRLPKPRQQVPFIVDGRHFRADFHFEEADVIGEADGRSKYGPDGAGSAPDQRPLWDEKSREDSLRSIVRGFARWDWGHALNGEGLRIRLERAGVHPVR